MTKKLDELNDKKYKDPNSPESQKFLWELHKRSTERSKRMKKMVEDWKAEDRQNENK